MKFILSLLEKIKCKLFFCAYLVKRAPLPNPPPLVLCQLLIGLCIFRKQDYRTDLARINLQLVLTQSRHIINTIGG